MNILPIKTNSHYSAINKQTNHATFKAMISNPVVEKGLIGLGTLGLATIELQKKNLQNIKTDNLLTQDSDGNTIFNKVNDKNKLLLSDTEFALINEQLKKSPELLKQIYLTPNNKGNLPAHRDLGLNKRKIMHEVLKDYPEILAQIYLTEDNYHYIPTDSISWKDDFSEFMEIISILKEQPNIIDKILEYYPQGDINNRWDGFNGWYDVRTNITLSSKQKEMIEKRRGHYNIINKEPTIENISTIVNLLKNNPETLSKLLSNLTFFVDINNHSKVLDLFKDSIPEVLADIYLYGRVNWNKPGEYEEHQPVYLVSEPEVVGIPLANEQKNNMKNDIIELALNSNLNMSKSKQLLKKYCQNMIGYDSIIKELEKGELDELNKK